MEFVSEIDSSLRWPEANRDKGIIIKSNFIMHRIVDDDDDLRNYLLKKINIIPFYLFVNYYLNINV
jgi:L-lysine 2,3-aminomutase